MPRTAPLAAAFALAAVMTPTLADAQPTPSPTPSSPASATNSAPRESGDLDPNAALALSLGPPLLGLGLAVAADQTASDGLGLVSAGLLILGPSAGHWYSGEAFTRGLAIRGAGMAVATVGAVVVLGDALDSDSSSDGGGGAAILLIGAGLFVAGIVDDVVTAPGAARARNRERAGGLAVVPTATRHGGGLAVLGQF